MPELANSIDAYNAAYEKATLEYDAAIEERAEIDKRILYLRQTKATLMRLMGMALPNAIQNKGITDAVRDYLQWAKRHHPTQPVTIREIRDQLESAGYDFSNHKNPNASVSGTLERLHEAKEVHKRRRRRDDGVTVTGYMWAGTLPELPERQEDSKGAEDDKE